MGENNKIQRGSLSWVDLSDEELVKVTDTTVCMYGVQEEDEDDEEE